MPHFIAKEEKIPLPLQVEEFIFCEEFVDTKYPSQSLILTKFHQQVFFIKKSKHPLGFLFKVHKHTRPSLSGMIKDALKILSSFCEVLSHNLSQNTPRQISQSPFLLDSKEILDLKLKNFVLEIGFGSGRHLLNLAQKNQNTQFIGIEIHTPSIEQILRQIKLLELKNLFITRLDARILASILPSNCCEQIHLHFPVPWNKRPHRRVLTQNFLKEALRILKPHSHLHLRTDDAKYFQDSLQLALQEQQASLSVQKNIPQDIISKYEARWLKEQKDIFDLKIQSLQSHPDIHLLYDFKFPYSANQMAFPKQTLQKDFFIHLNASFYAKDSIILHVSFGDFHWPNSKFILIDHQHQTTAFLGEAPLATPANIRAHQKIIQYLEGK